MIEHQNENESHYIYYHSISLPLETENNFFILDFRVLCFNGKNKKNVCIVKF